MAQSTTPRLGLTTWSSDLDQHGGREVANQNHSQLERLVAVWAGKGLLSARPAAAVEGRFYLATNVGDSGRLAVDDGTRWVELSTLGGGGAPQPVDVGGPGSEGVSQRAMRSDARIPLPLATADNHGAMASQWAELLENATANGSPWTLPIRDGSGRVRLGADPAHALDAASRRWVENTVGTFEVTPNALVRRYSNGSFRVPSPSGPDDVTPKRYVDSRASRAGWKTSIRPIPYGLDELTRLPLHSWEYADDAPHEGAGYGPMVEDVALHMPDLATTGADGAPERVRDRDMVWVLAKAVQELAADNRRLWDIVGEHAGHLDALTAGDDE